MAQQTPIEALKRYLEDAIAAENNFENQLRAMANEADQPAVQQLFQQHAQETRRQQDRLNQRLRELGGSPSGVKGFLANMFGFAPKMAQVGHEAAERSTQDLIMVYAVEHSEIAMYEALATCAAAAGDTETEQLARSIQEEERATAEAVWSLLASSATDAFSRVTGTPATAPAMSVPPTI